MKARCRSGSLVACLTALPLFPATPATAQDAPVPGRDLSEHLDAATDIQQPAPDEEAESESESEKTSRDLLIVPIPQSSPSLGFGLTLVGALFYNPNKSPEPWITGIGLLRTTNGSKAAGVMHKMMLADDKFRLTAFAGHADVNVDFFGIGANAGERGRSIELNEEGYAGIIQGEMRAAPNVYFGARLIYVDLSTSINRGNPLFPDAEIPSLEFDTKLAEVGPVVTFDRRDNSLTPTKGELVTAAWVFGVDALGSDFEHDKVTIAGNIYRPLGRRTVIAARASYCGVSTGGPFYDLCLTA